MKEILYENSKINNLFSKEELNEMFDPHKYTGKSIDQVENLIKFIKSKYGW